MGGHLSALSIPRIGGSGELDEGDRLTVVDCTVSMARAHTIVLIVFALTVGVLVPLLHVVRGFSPIAMANALLGHGLWLTALFMFASIVVHEMLHAVGFRTSAQIPWGEIKFGIRWTSLTPYATTQAAMPAWAYRQAALLPAWVLGVLPIVLGVAFRSELLAAYGIVMLGGAGGDIAAVWAMRHVRQDAIVRDSSVRVGCQVLARRRSQPVTAERTAERRAATAA